MVNCNPETVSTDYDTSDRLYFEPLTLEDVLEVLHAESQSGEIFGVICQLGGQTPLGLAKGIKAAGYTVLGTSPAAIDLAEDRKLFGEILERGGLLAPRNGTATSESEATGSPRRSATRCSCARRSFWAGAAWRSCTTRRACTITSSALPPTPSSAKRRRCSLIASSTTPWRSTSTHCSTATSSTSAASWSTSRRPASTPATRRAPCRRCRSGAARSSAWSRRRARSRRASGFAGC